MIDPKQSSNDWLAKKVFLCLSYYFDVGNAFISKSQYEKSLTVDKTFTVYVQTKKHTFYFLLSPVINKHIDCAKQIFMLWFMLLSSIVSNIKLCIALLYLD